MTIPNKLDNRYIIDTLIKKGRNYRLFTATDIQNPDSKILIHEIIETSPNPTNYKAAQYIFKKEVKELVQLSHPGIINFMEGFVENYRFYLVSEDFQGKYLIDIMKQKGIQTFTPEQILEKASNIIEIVSYLISLPKKQKPYINLNPASFVMLSSGEILMINPGTADLFYSRDNDQKPEAHAHKTKKKNYAYDVASIIYYLFTGKMPEKKDPISPSTINPDIPEEISLELIQILQNPGIINTILEIDIRLRRAFEKVERKKARELEKTRKKKEKLQFARQLGITAIIFLIISAGVFLFLGQFKNEIYYRICIKNTEKIRNALEKYASDHQGKYPEKLNQLTPDYLKKIPVCWTLPEASYADNYHGYSIGGYNYCRFQCPGNHPGLGGGTGFPRYNSLDGILLREPPNSMGNNPMDYLINAYLSAEKGNNEEALRILGNLTMIDSEVLEKRGGIEKYYVFWNMARILEKMKEPGKALKKYRSARDSMLSDNTPEISAEINALLKDYRALAPPGETKKFYMLYTKKLIIQRQDIETIAQIVDIYETMGWKKEAIAFLETNINQLQKNQAFVMAEIYRLKNNPRKACQLYDRILSVPVSETISKIIKNRKKYRKK
ncbi:MAG: hypothetical protein ACLFQV_00090 [Vulcanimicrobiota bacterium]